MFSEISIPLLVNDDSDRLLLICYIIVIMSFFIWVSSTIKLITVI